MKSSGYFSLCFAYDFCWLFVFNAKLTVSRARLVWNILYERSLASLFSFLHDTLLASKGEYSTALHRSNTKIIFSSPTRMEETTQYQKWSLSVDGGYEKAMFSSFFLGLIALLFSIAFFSKISASWSSIVKSNLKIFAVVLFRFLANKLDRDDKSHLKSIDKFNKVVNGTLWQRQFRPSRGKTRQKMWKEINSRIYERLRRRKNTQNAWPHVKNT